MIGFLKTILTIILELLWLYFTLFVGAMVAIPIFHLTDNPYVLFIITGIVCLSLYFARVYVSSYDIPFHYKIKRNEKRNLNSALKNKAFVELFGNKPVKDIIKGELFHHYVCKDGSVLKFIKLSETGKWACIFGEYYPLDLIAGYDRYSYSLRTIFGDVLTLPNDACRNYAKVEFKPFFAHRGRYYYESPHVISSFNEFIKDSNIDITKESTQKLRYIWNKLEADDKYSKSFTPVLEDGQINPDIYERTLSDKEIQKYLSYIRNDKLSLDNLFDINLYTSCYGVFNAIELLQRLPYDERLKRTDFLFDCICRVDEPYFFVACSMLLSFSKPLIQSKIEENAKTAYNNKDVGKMGGLLYLARQMDYEIVFVKELKEKAKSGAKEANTIKKFELDKSHIYDDTKVLPFNESLVYGSEDPEGFNPQVGAVIT